MPIRTLLKRIFSRNNLWSAAIHEANEIDLENISLKLNKVFNSRKIRLNSILPHTLADPFLMVKDNTLYLFLESQSPRQQGKIIAYMTTDLKNYQSLGTILKEDHHLSYPFVFTHNDSQYLIPESESAGEVALYKFEDFPYRPKKIKVLLNGDYHDSSLFFHHKIWYLFTTSSKGLEIFWTENLIESTFQPHPANPITNNPKFSRSAGSIFVVNNKILRPCQDCSNSYGENIHIMEITELSTYKYIERKIYNNFLNSKFSMWNKNGGHHLSIVKFMDKYILATDKKHYDLFINRFLSLLGRL